MADNALVLEQARDVACTKPGHTVDVEIRERLAKMRTFAENRQPAQSGLESFEADLLEQPAVVGHGRPPFLVVIAEVEEIVAGPPAARDPIGVANETSSKAHDAIIRLQWSISSSRVPRGRIQ